MAIKSFDRGNEIYFLDGQWKYSFDNKIVDHKRKCSKCGKKPTSEGYDSCLGELKNVEHACCGHGVEKKVIIYGN